MISLYSEVKEVFVSHTASKCSELACGVLSLISVASNSHIIDLVQKSYFESQAASDIVFNLGNNISSENICSVVKENNI